MTGFETMDCTAQVRLAKEAREHAVQALEKEPDSDLAHHLMGRYSLVLSPQALARSTTAVHCLATALSIILPRKPGAKDSNAIN